MTEITLKLTKEELKLIDKYIELNDETQGVFEKIKDAYPQPQMNLQQEGEYAVVSYHDKVYYRLESEVTFLWYIKKGVSANHRVPTLVMVEDAETERLLEGLYYNHIQVKKEKEQRTKTSVEEAFKDWWGQYPETGTWDSFDDTRWQGFQAGYNAAYEEKVAQEPEEEPEELKTLHQMFYEKKLNNLSCDEFCDVVKEWMSQYTHNVMTGEYLNGYEECLTVLEENLK